MRRTLVLLAVTAAALALAGSAVAIVFGQLDGNRHPNVGALVYEDEDGERGILCSGTLIAPDVFLTASHCTAFLESIGVAPDNVWVTFDPTFDAASPLLPGTYHTHPEFGASPSFKDTHDVAVVVLDDPATGIAPAGLPTLDQLDEMSLRSQRFVAVGYGTARDDKTKGPQSLFFDGQRRFAEQSFNALNKQWLRLSMNPSTGRGGACSGDSGGPHFIGSSNIVASLTITGDRFCRAIDVSYRLDTASARAFLDDFVTLP
ncbi:MAG TPA: trypsin-like serine protease [Gaiellaceae bacterium]|nr:trypsin-like serine protease [Gaiellaceae bacterium]